MFRHVALFKWKPEATKADRAAVWEGLSRLPAQIPELRSYVLGEDAGLTDTNYDFAVVADFDDEEGYRVYVDHPAHDKVRNETIAPIRAERAVIQYHYNP
jgi:hypothetical protein